MTEVVTRMAIRERHHLAQPHVSKVRMIRATRRIGLAQREYQGLEGRGLRAHLRNEQILSAGRRRRAGIVR
jgi:hypothetical protein